jgi:hypothetical protein
LVLLDADFNGSGELSSGGSLLDPRVLFDSANRTRQIGVEQMDSVLHIRQVAQLHPIGAGVPDKFNIRDLKRFPVSDSVAEAPHDSSRSDAHRCPSQDSAQACEYRWLSRKKR